MGEGPWRTDWQQRADRVSQWLRSIRGVVAVDVQDGADFLTITVEPDHFASVAKQLCPEPIPVEGFRVVCVEGLADWQKAR